MPLIRVQNTSSQRFFVPEPVSMELSPGQFSPWIDAKIGDLENAYDLMRLKATKIIAVQIKDEYDNAVFEPARLSSIQEGGSTPPPLTQAGGGWVTIYDVRPANVGDVVADKTYQDPNNNTVIETCKAYTTQVEFLVRASHPIVRIGAVQAILSLSVDGGHYSGAIPVTLGAEGEYKAQVLTPDGNLGPLDTVTISLDTPPEIVSLSFTGSYPGSQTELKEDDTFQITGTLSKPGTRVDILNVGACKADSFTFPLSSTFTITGRIANRGTTTQMLAASCRAFNSVGAGSTTRTTNMSGLSRNGIELVALNNTYPTVTFTTPVYPLGQGALKNLEQASVGVTYLNTNTVDFESPVIAPDLSPQLLVINPTTMEATKIVQRQAGSYNVTNPNLRVWAVRTANNAMTMANTIVRIANVPAQLSINNGPNARLISGGRDGTAVQLHTITINTNQLLLSRPTLDNTPGGGVLQGTEWAGTVATATAYTRQLAVHDDYVKGTYNWINPSAMNLAGLMTNSITGPTTYVLGGFAARDLVFSFFSRQTTMNVAVTDYSKLVATLFTATNQPAVRMVTQGDTSDMANRFTVLQMNNNPTTIWWNDAEAAASNSGGTARVTQVRETP